MYNFFKDDPLGNKIPVMTVADKHDPWGNKMPVMTVADKHDPWGNKIPVMTVADKHDADAYLEKSGFAITKVVEVPRSRQTLILM